MTELRILAFALLACGLFLAFSLLLNRVLRGEWPRLQPGAAALHASFVFALAVTCEVLVNSGYERLFGHKLWEYRVWPAHQGDVSQLAPLVWSAYGLHLYWLRDSLAARFGRLGRDNRFRALLAGVEAPLFFEVLGNLLFLGFLGTFYARYVPGDLWHLTSIQVVPVYAACSWLGYTLLDALLQARASRRLLAPGFIAAGLFVVLGPGA